LRDLAKPHPTESRRLRRELPYGSLVGFRSSSSPFAFVLVVCGYIVKRRVRERPAAVG
jgi:hypothetical protein